LTGLETSLVSICRSRPGSPHTVRGTFGGHSAGQLEGLVVRRHDGDADHGRAEPADVELDGLDAEPGRFHLRQVQHVVDDGHERAESGHARIGLDDQMAEGEQRQRLVLRSTRMD
jgi:hypothetical protein